MSKLWMKWFGGMVPRRGEQHLTDKRLEETGYFRQPQVNPNFEIESGINATEAENCNLYSGELRPLKKPALAHTFCRPGDECWHVPIPDDPSVPPPEPPPEPPNCIPVVIAYELCKVYECDAYHKAVIASSPSAYWPMNIQSDLDAYPASQSIKDYSVNSNDLLWWGTPADLATTPNSLANYGACGPNMTSMNNDGGADLRPGDTINNFAFGDDWTFLIHNGLWGAGSGHDAWLINVIVDVAGGGQRIFRVRTEDVASDLLWVTSINNDRSFALEAIDPDWRTKVMGVRCWWDGTNEQMELLLDFEVVATAVFSFNSSFLQGASPVGMSIVQLGFLSAQTFQECSLWNSKLTDAELLGLKEKFVLNDPNYVDPNPNCRPP